MDYRTDEEQVERLREFWRENGWFLIGGVALGALILLGWSQYNGYRARQSEQAAVLYQSLKQAAAANNTEQATELLSQLRKDFPKNPYTSQAGLLVAGAVLVAMPEQATEQLKFVMDNTSDPELALVARLRLARVLAYREQYDDALKLLAVDNAGQFAGRFNEVKGDIQVALGRTDEARAAYLAAMVADGSELLDRNFLQMKLNDLPPNGSAAPAEPASPPAANQPAAPAAGDGA